MNGKSGALRNPFTKNIYSTHAHTKRRILFVTHLISMYCFGHLNRNSTKFSIWIEKHSFRSKRNENEMKKEQRKKKTDKKNELQKNISEHYLYSRVNAGKKRMVEPFFIWKWTFWFSPFSVEWLSSFSWFSFRVDWVFMNLLEDRMFEIKTNVSQMLTTRFYGYCNTFCSFENFIFAECTEPHFKINIRQNEKYLSIFFENELNDMVLREFYCSTSILREFYCCTYLLWTAWLVSFLRFPHEN